ncbi:DUF4169 family protein [Maribius pontilimi]|uniref:DUF4169 family protein n=1 Tax=Palleronia pontilimi TaxID=1964209 RepID=A0A934IBE3_9RHOB|nr:DUF4169 family protein [Palleronia pontilimi]MBJ3763989.1 DUF4169 family protein [Palleronia pontilimi]
MSDTPINLNHARKDAERAKAKAQADENAVKHGRSKAERIAQAARCEKARRILDAHKFTDET